jgi:hypothetical protein
MAAREGLSAHAFGSRRRVRFHALISRGIIMRLTFAVLSALLVGIVFGAAGVHELRAQSKPPVYVVTEIAVRNIPGYVNEYAPRAQESIKKPAARFWRRA